MNWKRNTIFFISSQTLSFFGSALVQYAITWYITLKTQSGVMMAISIICGFLPTLFISPFAGVWADRYSKKKLIILSDSMIAVATLILALLFMAGFNDVWLLFAASAIRSLGGGIQSPAVGAFLPEIVPEDKLTRVNGINSTIQSLVILASPILSGALLTVASIDSIFFIDVITAAIAVFILLLFLKVPSGVKEPAAQKISYFADMKDGLKYIRHHAFLFLLFAFCSIYFVLAAPLAFLTPLQVTRSFGDDVWRLTAIEVAFAGGMAGGGLIIATWGGLKNKLYSMALSSLIISICTIALGIVPNFWIYTVLMGLTGLAMPMFNTPFTVLLQQKVEPEFMGRVFGVLSMISSSVMPLAMLLYGPLADAVKIEGILLITGALMLIQTVFMLKNRILIEAGKEIKEDGQQMTDKG